MNTKSEKAIREWLTAWKKRDYRKMFELSQVSWGLGKEQKNQLYIKNLYKNTELLDFDILLSEPIKYGTKGEVLTPEVMLQFFVVCKVFYKQVPICKDEIRVINVIQEDKEGKATTSDGIWGVNPMSALRKFKDEFLNVKFGETSKKELKEKLETA